MNRNQRRIIYEYAGYLDIDTVAYDQEPKRNVVATAERYGFLKPYLETVTIFLGENQRFQRFCCRPLSKKKIRSLPIAWCLQKPAKSKRALNQRKWRRCNCLGAFYVDDRFVIRLILLIGFNFFLILIFANEPGFPMFGSFWSRIPCTFNLIRCLFYDFW